MEILPQPDRDEIELAAVLQALADPVRLALVAQAANGEEHTCTGLGSEVGVHKSTLSHHYRTLREAGVTTVRLEGRVRYTRIRREDLDARFPGLFDAIIAGVDKGAPRDTSP